MTDLRTPNLAKKLVVFFSLLGLALTCRSVNVPALEIGVSGNWDNPIHPSFYSEPSPVPNLFIYYPITFFVCDFTKEKFCVAFVFVLDSDLKIYIRRIKGSEALPPGLVSQAVRLAASYQGKILMLSDISDSPCLQKEHLEQENIKPTNNLIVQMNGWHNAVCFLSDLIELYGNTSPYIFMTDAWWPNDYSKLELIELKAPWHDYAVKEPPSGMRKLHSAEVGDFLTGHGKLAGQSRKPSAEHPSPGQENPATTDE